MARVKIERPENIAFSTRIPVLVQHVNYGGHLSNDAVLAIAHEARIRFLRTFECTEMDAFGAGLIMKDAAVVYKNEGFQGELLTVEVAASDSSGIGFDLYYRMSTMKSEKEVLIAEVKTGMVCFDYDKRKPVRIPGELKIKLDL